MNWYIIFHGKIGFTLLQANDIATAASYGQKTYSDFATVVRFYPDREDLNEVVRKFNERCR